MSNAVLVKELSELLPFANKDNVVEIVMRGANKRFKAFQKVALADLQQNQGQEILCVILMNSTILTIMQY